MGSLLPWLSAAQKWPDVDKAELADPKPKVDPDASAEILLREVTFDHSALSQSEDTYYVRAKVYSQRGVEELSRVELPYNDKTSIRYIAARTIKPDGTIVELDPKDVFDRVLVKAGNIRANVKSFALPALEPGCIVEYIYTEYIAGPGDFIPMYFQNAFPQRKVRYKIRLLELSSDVAFRFTVRELNFNCSQQPLNPDKRNWYNFEMTNLAAAKDEPFQPPAVNILASMLVYYAPKNESASPAEYWGKFAKKLDKELDDVAKPTKAIRTALETIVTPADDEPAKLKKIYDFCRTKIVNRYADTSGYTDKQREKLKENTSAADVLKNGNGSHDDVNNLFTALVRAAGMEVHRVAGNDRTKIYFYQALTEAHYVFPDRLVAVRVAGQWQFFDPGSSYLPFGMLNWYNADTALLIGDKTGESQPIESPGSAAEASQTRRTAKFKLSEDGVLEGDVFLTFTGHCEISLKRLLDEKTTEEQEKYLREDLQEFQKLAELTDIKLENVTSPTEPLKIYYHLRVPQYAESTGSRLFIQPAFFQKGRPPWFEASTRRNSIVFDYRYATEDRVEIDLPTCYTPEEPSAPNSVELGTLGEYKTSLALLRKTNTLIYTRTFKLEVIGLNAKFYDLIKYAFEVIRDQDAHTVALKLKETPSAAPTSTVP